MIILKNEYIAPYFSNTVLDTNVSEKKDDTNKPSNRLESGSLYTLTGTECDDFKMPTKTYEMIGIIYELDGVKLNSAIMKQVDGEQGTIFSLTKVDCKNIGIEWQPGLQLFPLNLDWQKVEKNKDKKKPKGIPEGKYFLEEDLSTYPMCYADKTIRNIIIEVDWINFFNDNISFFNEHNVEPFGDIDFSSLFNIQFTDEFANIISGLYDVKREYKTIKYNVVTNKLIKGDDISRNPNLNTLGKLYLELSFAKKYQGNDGFIGILPEYFKNKSIDEVVTVSMKKSKFIIKPFAEGEQSHAFGQMSHVEGILPLRRIVPNMIPQTSGRHVSAKPKVSKSSQVKSYNDYDDDFMVSELDSIFDDVEKYLRRAKLEEDKARRKTDLCRYLYNRGLYGYDDFFVKMYE